jgi:transposase
MAYGNARLTVYGRRLLVRRVRVEGMAVAHVAKAMGISRQCAHRWVARWDAEGDDGLKDRSSRPYRSPNRTPVEVEERVVSARRVLRIGKDRLADELGVPARTVSRILRRYQMPYLSECGSGNGATGGAHLRMTNTPARFRLSGGPPSRTDRRRPSLFRPTPRLEPS